MHQLLHWVANELGRQESRAAPCERAANNAIRTDGALIRRANLRSWRHLHPSLISHASLAAGAGTTSSKSWFSPAMTHTKP